MTLALPELVAGSGKKRVRAIAPLNGILAI
jgi:hypothetical protein